MTMRFLIGFLCFICLASLARAEEVIDRYISTVAINADGSLDVREEITVLAEGVSIRHGILRDFPTDYKRPDGSTVRVGFKLLEAWHNAKPVEYKIEHISNGLRVRLGSAQLLLQPGFHTFILRYVTTRQLGFFPDHDELYWNVTGNGWTFPINEAYFNATLPGGAKINEAALFTGYTGSRNSEARVTKNDSGGFSANTTRKLDAGEGFSVALAWNKGIVTPPSAGQEWLWFVKDNAGFGVIAGTLALSFLYYLLLWSRVGRDPRAGTIIPLFHPPDGMDPASVRYNWQRSYDDGVFAAALVGLAVKRNISIKQDGSGYAIAKMQDRSTQLTQVEAALFAKLPEAETQLDQSNYRKMNAAEQALRNSLAEMFAGKFYLRNTGWFAAGLVLSVAGLLLAGFLMPGEFGVPFTFAGVFSAIWWSVVLTSVYAAGKGLFKARGLFDVAGKLIRLVFIIPFVVAGVIVPGVYFFHFGVSTSAIVFAALAALLGVENFIFYKLLPRPTPDGQRLMDRIEGFRQYMVTAEEKRLDALNPPEETPELFERYLPYAMALDCENQWNAKFTSVIAAAGAAAAAPVWYHGSGGFRSDGFAGSLSRGLSSSISSATTAPGSSSGFSSGSGRGGGFSGGGGGGGGGSGW